MDASPLRSSFQVGMTFENNDEPGIDLRMGGDVISETDSEFKAMNRKGMYVKEMKEDEYV